MRTYDISSAGRNRRGSELSWGLAYGCGEPPTPGGGRLRQACRWEGQGKQLCGQRAAVGGCFCGGGADCYLEWPRPVDLEFRFGDLGVRARFGPLPVGSGSVEDPYPASGELIEPVKQRRISALDAGNIDRVLFEHQGVRASLAVGIQVDVFQLTTNEAFMSTSVRVFEDGEGRGSGPHAPHWGPTRWRH